MFKNFPVIVDTVQKSKLNNIVVNSNDLKTIKLSLTINQLNKPIDLTGATVRIAIVKPDKKTVFQDCTITDPTTGSCEVILNTQAFIISGVYIAEVMIYFGADTVAVTGRFSYSVAKGILDNSTAESTNEWQSITQAIADAEGILIDLRENGTGIDVQARSELETVTTQLAEKAKQAELEALDKRLDAKVIDSGAANAQVTDALVSTTKNKVFPTISKRMEEVEKDADTTKIPLKNFIANADFNILTGWGVVSATISVENNKLLVKGNGAGAEVVATANTTEVWGTGKKIFGMVRARVTNPNCTKIKFYLRNAGGGLKIIEVINPIENQWYTLQDFVESPTTTAVSIWLSHTYADAATANLKTAEFEKIMVTDINAPLGVENSELIRMQLLEKHITNWRDGKVNLYSDSTTLQGVVQTKALVIGSRIEKVEKEVDAVKIPTTNFINNAEFDSVTGWSSISSIITAENKKLIVKGSGAGSQVAATITTSEIWGAGKKFFGIVRARVTNANCLKIQFYLRNAAGGIKIIEVPNPVENQWYTLYDVAESTSTTPLSIWLSHSYSDAASANLKIAEFEKVMVTDLNLPLGIENAEFIKQKLISKHSTGWKDGKIQLFNDSEILRDLLQANTQTSTSVYPASLPSSNITGVQMIQTSGRAFSPSSLGADGYVYATDGAIRGVIVRTNDGFSSFENGFNFGTTEAGFVKFVTKTKSGYVAVVSKGSAESAGASIYYSSSFTSGFAKVQDLALSVDRVSCSWEHEGPSGNTILFVGEYTNVLNTPHKLYMSLDGGQTWKHIHTTTVTNPNVNAHVHCGTYDPYSGKIYASFGDFENSHFYESTNLGVTWKEIFVSDNDYGLVNPIPYMQPIILIPMPNKIAYASDGLTVPSIWSLTKDKGYFAQGKEEYGVKFEVSVKDGISAGSFFPVSPFGKKGREAYILIQGPTPGTKREMYILGTGDNGESWHQLYSMKYDNTYEMAAWGNGIVGVDANGYLYAHHSWKKTGDTANTSVVLKIKTPDWL